MTRLVHISPSSTLGGLAEVIRAELPVLRRLGIATGWHTLRLDPATRINRAGLALHRALYAAAGAAPVDTAELMNPELTRVLAEFGDAEAQRLAPQVAGADLVVLHDPLSLPLAPRLRPLVGAVIWRCHIGHEEWSAEAEAAARHLRPFTESTDRLAFLRRAYCWPGLEDARTVIVPPGLNPELAKNRELPGEFLAQAGPALLTTGRLGPVVSRAAPGTAAGPPLDHHGTGFLTDPETPVILQVARWDPLKGQAGLAATFAAAVATSCAGAELVLVQPHIDATRNYPEDTAERQRLLAVRDAMPAALRRRVHVWSHPLTGTDEEATAVNVLQRAATVVAQNSLREGFGLTVTEGMWKRRAVVATAVGGITEQIVHGVNGLLAPPSRTTGAEVNPGLGRLLVAALGDRTGRERMGQAAQQAVRARYLAEQTVRRQLACVGLGSLAPA